MARERQQNGRLGCRFSTPRNLLSWSFSKPFSDCAVSAAFMCSPIKKKKGAHSILASPNTNKSNFVHTHRLENSQRGRWKSREEERVMGWWEFCGDGLSFSPFVFIFNNKKLLEWPEREAGSTRSFLFNVLSPF